MASRKHLFSVLRLSDPLQSRLFSYEKKKKIVPLNSLSSPFIPRPSTASDVPSFGPYFRFSRRISPREPGSAPGRIVKSGTCPPSRLGDTGDVGVRTRRAWLYTLLKSLFPFRVFSLQLSLIHRLSTLSNSKYNSLLNYCSLGFVGKGFLSF